MEYEDERRFLITAGKAALEEQVDYIPTLIVTDAEGHTTVMVLAGGHPFDAIQAVTPAIRDMRPTALSLTVDSYITTNPDGVALKMLFGGSLKRAFEAGTSGVSEALIVNMVTPTSQEVITLPYTRTPDGVVWGEDFASDVVDGRMIDALRAAWA
jgi:hypothetical protein